MTPKTPRPPRPTTIVDAPRLSKHLGVDLVLASETLQYTGSFKFRAAYNLLRSVPNPSVVTASSGNFGQAAALAARQLGKTCTVVMPSTSAQVKVDAGQAKGPIGLKKRARRTNSRPTWAV